MIQKASSFWALVHPIFHAKMQYNPDKTAWTNAYHNGMAKISDKNAGWNIVKAKDVAMLTFWYEHSIATATRSGPDKPK